MMYQTLVVTMPKGNMSLIGKTIQQRVDSGKWKTWGVVENADEASAVEARIKLGLHAINGGQNTCEFRVRPYRGRNAQPSTTGK